jgi:hypothetical protein
VGEISPCRDERERHKPGMEVRKGVHGARGALGDLGTDEMRLFASQTKQSNLAGRSQNNSILSL